MAEEKTMKERGNEEGDVVSQFKAMHEEDFWSSWLREDEKSKEERKAEAEGKGEEEGEKRKERRSKKRMKRGRLKEDVRVWFLWKFLKFLVKSEMWRVAEMFPGKTSWRSLRTCLIVSLLLVRMCVWCLM